MADLPRGAWTALAGPDATPFMSWDFLEALESSGSAIAEKGWWPQHLTIWRGKRLIAASPAYIKVDSAGDFSRDWGWHQVAQEVGVEYYPKLVVGVPFTPVPGRRVLVADDEDPDPIIVALMTLAVELAKAAELSSVNVLFCDPAEVEWFEAAGLFPRVLYQYHWHNQQYESSADWMATLTSKKRNQAKREQAEMAKRGIRIRTIRDGELTKNGSNWPSDVYRLYRRTCSKFVWGHPYLTEAFFEMVFTRMPENIEVVEATLDGRLVAAAFNLASPTRLFGRYWGSFEEHRFLHFNVCLYHSVAECIERGTQVFEGGMDGQHKLARGFEPVLVHSAHRFIDSQLNDMIQRYCDLERRARIDELAVWQEERRRR